MCGVMDMQCDFIADAYFKKAGEDDDDDSDGGGAGAQAKPPKSGEHWPLPRR